MAASQRPRHVQHPQHAQPTWEPIGMLPVIAQLVEGTLASTEEQHATLQEVRHWPHVLDDATVAHTRRVYTKTADDLWLRDLIVEPEEEQADDEMRRRVNSPHRGTRGR